MATAPPATDAHAAEEATTPTAAPAAPGPAERSSPRRLLFTGLRLFGALSLAAAIAALSYGGHRFLHHSPHFAIRAVRISPTAHTSSAALLERAAIPEGSNLFGLDLLRVQRDLKNNEPWLKSVRVRRELPATVAIDVTEYQPAALLALESLFLTDANGVVFKRATPAEAHGLAVITGLTRDGYVADRAEAQEQASRALLALALFAAGTDRPRLGEVHVDPFAGITLYTDQGVAIRLGHGGAAEWAPRLVRFDAVWASLPHGPESPRPSILFLDNRAHPDHVIVRMEGEAVAAR